MGSLSFHSSRCERFTQDCRRANARHARLPPEGTHAECGQWIEDLGLYYKGDVGISPAGVTMFVPVQRAAVHKRIKEGKLTAFFFYITRVESTFFGTKRKVKLRPYILLSMSECKAWVVEMKRRMGYVDEPDESLMEQRKKLKPVAAADEPKTAKEAVEALGFADTDPKDKGTGKSDMRTIEHGKPATGHVLLLRKRWQRWRPTKEG